jgi:RNA polymerase sigma-70 factor, ECF subfamily
VHRPPVRTGPVSRERQPDRLVYAPSGRHYIGTPRPNGDSIIAFDGDHPQGSTPAATARDEEAGRIVGAVLAGDRDAFRVLVEREAIATVRACYRVLADRDDAEDAAQEAFVIAFQALDTWRATGPFGAWLRRIAIRVAVRRAANQKRTLRLDPLVEGDELPRPTWTLDRRGDDASDPADASLAAERASEIRGAIQSLAEPYREVVLLRFYGDLTLAEIADQTGRPLATVKTHLRRGLLQLRAMTSQDGLDP